jgi:hypothetical protein
VNPAAIGGGVDIRTFLSGWLSPLRDARRTVVMLIAAIVAIDLLLIALHPTYQAGRDGWRGDVRFRLDKDRGYAEFFGALQLVTASTLLLHSWSRRRTAPVMFAWSLSFVALVVDDLFSLHERGGERLRSSLEDLAGSNAQQAGELVVFACIGAAIAASVALTHRRSDRSARLWSWRLGIGLVLLMGAGLGLDVVHSLAEDGSAVAGALTIAEDGGEMIAMTLILVTAICAWLALALSRPDGSASEGASTEPSARHDD